MSDTVFLKLAHLLLFTVYCTQDVQGIREICSNASVIDPFSVDRDSGKEKSILCY